MAPKNGASRGRQNGAWRGPQKTGLRVGLKNGHSRSLVLFPRGRQTPPAKITGATLPTWRVEWSRPPTSRVAQLIRRQRFYLRSRGRVRRCENAIGSAHAAVSPALLSVIVLRSD